MFVVALVAVVVITTRPRATPSEAATLPVSEKPWLSHAAQDQIIGPQGTLGPLFVGVTLGGPAPAPEIRERIAAFALENDVAIDFEVTDDELVAIRFDVTFGGCCGYEAVDILAARIGQPMHLGGCSGPNYYFNNWARANEDGTHVRAMVRVNRLSLRWEHTLALDDVITRAERALNTDRGTISESAGDRWVELDAAKYYVLELPYAFVNTHVNDASRSQPSDRGIQLVTDRRIVTEASFTTNDANVRKRLKARWGKPRVTADGEWLWYKSDRTIVAVIDDYRTTITLSRR